MKAAAEWMEATPGEESPMGDSPDAPAPFPWALRDAAEVWTRDPSAQSALLDSPIIEGLMREREIVSFVGAAKSQKTWLALALALSVSSGTPFLGRQTYKRRVAYLDFELKSGSFAYRLSRLAAGSPDNFEFSCLRGADRLPRIADVEAMVKERGIGLVIIDSLYKTQWLTEENSNDAVTRDLAPLQTLTRNTGASVVIIDHAAKGNLSERSTVDSARGASAKAGFADSVFVLKMSDKGADPNADYITLDAAVRDWPPLRETPLIAFRHTAEGASIEVEGSVPRVADDSATRILEALASAGTYAGVDAVAKATGLSVTTARDKLRELEAKGRVESMDDPAHKQRRLYILKPRETAHNRA